MNRLVELMTVAAVALALSAPAAAQSTPGVQDFSGATTSLGTGIGFPYTTGWTFTPNASVSVTDLGLYDIGSDGLVASHQIGLWNGAGLLVTTGTVASGMSAPVQNGWRYVDVADVLLNVGETYTLGAAYAYDTDPFPYNPTSLTVDPRIGFGQGVASDLSTGFTQPTLTRPYAILGPNLLLAPAIPEPGAWALMMAGLMLAGMTLRRSAGAVRRVVRSPGHG